MRHLLAPVAFTLVYGIPLFLTATGLKPRWLARPYLWLARRGQPEERR